MRIVAVFLAAACLFGTAVVATARPSLTRTQAKALAHAINLQAGDLPGHNLIPADDTSTEDIWGNGRVAHCMGRKTFGRELADVSSPLFEDPDSESFASIESEVE